MKNNYQRESGLGTNMISRSVTKDFFLDWFKKRDIINWYSFVSIDDSGKGKR